MGQAIFEIPQEHADFLAACAAKREGLIKAGPAFSRLDETGLQVAFKAVSADDADWVFVQFENQEITL